MRCWCRYGGWAFLVAQGAKRESGLRFLRPTALVIKASLLALAFRVLWGPAAGVPALRLSAHPYWSEEPVVPLVQALR